MKIKTFYPILIAALVLLVTASTIVFGLPSSEREPNSNAEARERVAQTPVASSQDHAVALSLQASFRTVSATVLPVVVEVNTIEVIEQSRNFNWPFSQNRGQQQFERPGLGSGVIVGQERNRAYVLTNNHVVGSADEIGVSLFDGRDFEAKIVGNDARLDLALLEFTTREDVPIAALGDSDSLYVGDWVIAIGNPYGFESTVTAGIVSALGRRPDPNAQFSSFTDYIQTDAAINSGNSGGALVNLNGEIIGINTWIASQSGGSIGLGFAIPVNTAKRAIDDFLKHGKIVYGWLGVTIADSREVPGVATDLNVGDRKGSFITNVFEGSPADRGGVQPGDFIVEVNGKEVVNRDHLTVVIGTLKPDSPIDVTVLRSGREEQLEVVLKERDETAQNSANYWPGVWVASLLDQVRSAGQVPENVSGVFVYELTPDSPAAKAGLSRGDVITEFAGKKVKDLKEFYEALNASRNSATSVEVYREGNTVRLTFTS